MCDKDSIPDAVREIVTRWAEWIETVSADMEDTEIGDYRQSFLREKETVLRALAQQGERDPLEQYPVVVTTNERGEVVSVARHGRDGQIVKVIWEREPDSGEGDD